MRRFYCMTAFDLLLIVTASVLGVGAFVLMTRRGAERALALLLAANALLCVRGLSWSANALAQLQTDAVGVAALALFACIPPLVALSARRARAGGPLLLSDLKYALPAVAAVAVCAPIVAWWSGDRMLPLSTEILYLLGLNIVAFWSFRAARRDVAALPAPMRLVGGRLWKVFVFHWTFSMSAWVTHLGGAPRAVVVVCQVVSVGSLLAFGAYAAWTALRRLPSIPHPTPLDPEVEQSDARLAARLHDAL